MAIQHWRKKASDRLNSVSSVRLSPVAWCLVVVVVMLPNEQSNDSVRFSVRGKMQRNAVRKKHFHFDKVKQQQQQSVNLHHRHSSQFTLHLGEKSRHSLAHLFA